MKKTNLCLFLGIFSILLFSCGSTDIEKYPQKIATVVDGNSIRLENGSLVHLIGLEDSKESEKHLKSLVGTEVLLTQDSKSYENITNDTKEIYVYLRYLKDSKCINAEVLKKGFSNLNKTNLNDSLKLFSSYINKTNKFGKLLGDKDEDNNNNESSEDQDDNQNDKMGTLEKVVEEVSEAVFTIHATDNYGDQVLGSGFFISSEGEGITNMHVLEDAQIAFIRMKDGAFYKIKKIMQYSRSLDYVKFKVFSKNKEFPYLKIANKSPKAGAEIFVIGSPKGLEQTVTRGIISAIRDKDEEDDAILQIDAAISSGSSGGPVMNMQGKVVGIATSTRTDGNNLNFAMNIVAIMKHIKETTKK